ncbi:hypothetical protein MVES1_003126 [Malassezia vespertilionis]|uniref:Uncharacterized protein n=1 Tax=Malassezia vespertilionis TaxID=2020962 RepID=A0A2N1J8U8_9BASI|nr:uncharacterized protein MVES1_003126 [Malassezia vespertilionis]PKI82978.1 hypothetical protein MVES_002967 [Malassezia vespertilionis]WFD07756.1 hypothetical protein MVES1_003126 [Malassezia vespertilionis]
MRHGSGGDFAIPVSAEEQLRRDIEHELDVHMKPSPNFFARRNAPLHMGLRGTPLRTAFYEDESDTSDDEMLMRSTGNHGALFATPRGKQPRPVRHARPTLSHAANEQLNIARLAGEAVEDPVPRRRLSPVARLSPQRSRQSSGETKVGSDDGYKKQPAKSVAWAEQQLADMVHCIKTMEREMERLRENAPNVLLERRVDAMEAGLDNQKEQLARLTSQFEAHVASSPASRAPRTDDAIVQLLARLNSAQAPPPEAEQNASLHTGIQRLYDELERVSNAVKHLQHTAVGTRAHTPPLRPSAFPLTPPYKEECTEPDEYPHAQERYEAICRTVAEALGLAPHASPRQTEHEKHTRKDKIRASMRHRVAEDMATESLLRRLAETPAPVLAKHELRLLEHLFEQHKREFLHQRQLYSELADELKCMEPGMDKAKRRILAKHVHESIDSLEAEATRINDLRAHLARQGYTMH